MRRDLMLLSTSRLRCAFVTESVLWDCRLSAQLKGKVTLTLPRDSLCQAFDFYSITQAGAACGMEDIQLLFQPSFFFALVSLKIENKNVRICLRFHFVCALIISYMLLLANRLSSHLFGTHMHTETNSLSFALSNMLCFSLFNLLGNSLAARASGEGQKESECVLKSCS